MHLSRNKKGVVYIAYNKSIPRLVKIGVSQNCHIKRVKSLNNQSVPFDFEILAAFQSEKSLEFEQYVHANLRNYWVAKEFFKLDKESAIHNLEVLASTFQHKAFRL